MNGKKLTQEERGQYVTKGHLEDVLNEKDYVSKEYMVEQNYVNNTTFREAIDVLVNLIERQGREFKDLLLREKEEFRRYVLSLQEHHTGLVSSMGEVCDFKIEQIEKRVDALEQRL